MKILLVNPKIPDTYWSFKHAIKFISKKSASLPLGLITISAMLPEEWEKKVIDMNIEPLKNRDIIWADYVYITAMSVQSESVDEVISRVQHMGKKVVAGGPHFTGNPENYNHVEHLVLNEAEITFPRFLEGLEECWPMRVYRTDEFADISTSPVPDYHLLNWKKYASLSIQYSRGCPHDCEFCEITALLGRKVRTKQSAQIMLELDNIYKTGYRGGVFFVDDNFIGNKKKLKQDLLPKIIQWNKIHNKPFTFNTEASIDLADDIELMEMMARAGFIQVFVGIETPDEDSLKECNKRLNIERNLVDSVRLIQAYGIEVTAGFIVGFDNDKGNIFKKQVEFIEKSGIITAMVGLLNAPSRTKLYKRLSDEGRIIGINDGNNTSDIMNFVPIMDKETLVKGYHSILESIYSAKAYTRRVISFIKDYTPGMERRPGVTFEKIGALAKSIWILGLVSRDRKSFWQLLFWSLFNRPEMLTHAVTYHIYGYHFRKVFGIRSN